MPTRTLKDQLEAEIAESEAKEKAKPGFHDGSDWWQLTEAEQEVFEIDRERFPRMIMTWHCYDGFKRMADSPVWDDTLIGQARQQHPEWCTEAKRQLAEISVQEFQAFAKEFGGLTFREAEAIYRKHEFWQIRLGVVTYGDE
jgi:hypothetical protein